MKRLILLGIILAVFFSSPVHSVVLYADTFTRANNDTVGGSWAENQPASTNVSIVSNALRIRDDTGGSGPIVYLQLTNFSANSTVEFDVKVTTVTDWACGVSINSNRYNAGSWSNEYATTTNGVTAGKISSFTEATETVVLNAYNANDTYRVKYTNFNYGANTYDLTVNGTTVSDDSEATDPTQPYFSCWTTDGFTTAEIQIDNFCHYNGTTAYSECLTLTVPSITQSTYNVTSAIENGTVWRTNTTFSVNTTDSTPTVTFSTTSTGNCSIGTANMNYSTMIANDSNTKCGTVDTSSMTCTLPESKALQQGSQNIYIACRATDGGETSASTSGALNITLVSNATLESLARSRIETAMINALGSPIIYTGQQIYLRRLNGTQLLGTFDKVAVFGNQRWAVNYLIGSDSYVAMGNLTPVLYTFELTNSFATLQAQVESFINSTKI